MCDVCISDMAGGPVDPREILKGVEALLGKDGELRSLEGVPKVFRYENKRRHDIGLCFYCKLKQLSYNSYTMVSYYFFSFSMQPDESFYEDG